MFFFLLDDEIDQLKSAFTKLQHDYDESLANCAQLTQTIDTQRQEIVTLKTQQQTEFDNNLKELHEENDRVKSQIEKLMSDNESLHGALKEREKQFEKLLEERGKELEDAQGKLKESHEEERCYCSLRDRAKIRGCVFLSFLLELFANQ